MRFLEIDGVDPLFLASLKLGVSMHVSEIVPETTPPPYCETVGEASCGKRTDFGRHFRSDTFVRGTGIPAPVPTPCYFMIRGECHMHPKTFEKFRQYLKEA